MALPSPDALLLARVQRLYDWLLDEYGVLVGYYRVAAVMVLMLCSSVYVLATEGTLAALFVILSDAAFFYLICGSEIRHDLRDQRAGRLQALNCRAMRKHFRGRVAGFLSCVFVCTLLKAPEVVLTTGVPVYVFWLTQAVMVRERRPPARQTRMIAAGSAA